MIDTHAHLTDKQFDPDRCNVIKEANRVGVEKIVTVADSLTDSRKCIELARRYPSIFATAGVHPHQANEWEAGGSLLALKTLAPHAIAIGEIGLDYFYDFSDPDIQRQVFVEQLEFATECNKPVIIHCRDAFKDLIDLLGKMIRTGLQGVVHCFTGTAEEADALLDMGYYLSFGGMITFPKLGYIRDVASHCPLDRILLETDCPYLAPVPFRGKRNQPAYVVKVYRKLAEIKKLSDEDVKNAVHRNFQQCFFRK